MNPIKTRLTLNLKRRYSFFMFDGEEYNLAICNAFASKVLGIDTLNSLSEIKASIASKNPKRKNWKKILRTDREYVSFDGSSFPICYQERDFLDQMGIEPEQSFWMKIEVLG